MTRLAGIDLDLDTLCLGANTFGWTSNRESSFAVLDTYRNAGGNFIDTADVYSAWAPGNSGGESETVLGEWIALRGGRDSLAIATKVGAHPDAKGLAPEMVGAACEVSLRRLGTPYIDLYYAHYDDPERPIEEIAETFDSLVKTGVVHAIGISNFAPERIRAWCEHAQREGLTQPVAMQPHYNLVHRAEFEESLRPIADAFELAVFSYFSLAAGLLTGKYHGKDDLGGRDRSDMLTVYGTDDGFRAVEAVVEIAHERAITPAEVALAWLRVQGVAAPIASARTVEQLTPLLRGRTLELTAEEVAALDDASAGL